MVNSFNLLKSWRVKYPFIAIAPTTLKPPEVEAQMGLIGTCASAVIKKGERVWMFKNEKDRDKFVGSYPHVVLVEAFEDLVLPAPGLG